MTGGLMVIVSASKPRDRGFELHTGPDHDSSYETSAGWEVGWFLFSGSGLDSDLNKL